MTETGPERAGEGRWQGWLRRAREPLFLLSRHRRLLFGNPAWEACTGLTLAAVRGLVCRPGRGRTRDAGEAVLAALAPPAEALAGQTCRARRHAPGGGWWQLDFFPITGPDRLLGVVGKITPLPTPPTVGAPLPERPLALRDRQAEAFRLDALAGEVPAMRRVREQARLAATGRVPVTLVGAAGTGKHWLARAIHHAGPTRDRSFACIDCRALPPALVADILLEPRGRRLGLGTVYLREPAELPRELQDRLAEHVGEGEGPRLIAGHRDELGGLVRAGRLVEELHVALGTLTIHLPPLRERRADVEWLAGAFLERVRLLTEKPVATVGPEALAALRGHDWPGNLRELFDVLLSAAAHAKGNRIEPADLPFFLHAGAPPATKPLPLDELLAEAERRLILRALRQAGGNRTRAAEVLGIWRPRLLRRMEHFGINPGEPSEPEA